MHQSFRYMPLLVVLLLSACSTPKATTPASPISNAGPTPTPTEMAGPVVVTPTATASRCAGLAGTLELQLLVGPAEAVGLEPVAVGSIPFSVVTDSAPYLVEGSGSVSYDNMLEEVWGTYTVSFDGNLTVTGECIGEEGAELLSMQAEMTGEQMVEVQAEGFQGEYPWSGTQSLELAFPLEEGAQASGEGWVLVLHLSK
jgi:hypothetical protein